MDTYDLVKKETRKKRGESHHDYQLRIHQEVCEKLSAIEDRTPDQDSELENANEYVAAYAYIKVGGISSAVGDRGMTRLSQIIHQDLIRQYGNETPMKRILMERLVAAHAMAYSYDYTFQMIKYDKTEKGQVFRSDKERVNHLAEARKGVEMANNQILRLTQALENINKPQVNIQATNAYIAHMQQFNTTPQTQNSAKDLEVETITSK